jgi:hypothetical protein
MSVTRAVVIAVIVPIGVAIAIAAAMVMIDWKHHAPGQCREQKGKGN